jgi:hypothetical protein
MDGVIVDGLYTWERPAGEGADELADPMRVQPQYAR